MACTQHKQTRFGFTLMELVVVVGLISVIAAIALPQLLPVIAFSTHEGAARRLAGYGQNAMGRATLMHEKMTVHVDLGQQEYWTMRWPEPEPKDKKDAGNDRRDDTPLSPLDVLSIANSALAGRADKADHEKLDEEAQAMRENFDRLQQRIITTQAEHVKHDNQGILGEIGNLFDRNVRLDADIEELKPEEITEPLLQRSRLPDGIFIESVSVGADTITRGIAEIEISPTGLADKVVFYLRDSKQEYFTIIWDPIVGAGRIRSGKVDKP